MAETFEKDAMKYLKKLMVRLWDLAETVHYKKRVQENT